MANLRSLSAVGLLFWAFAAGTVSLPAAEKSPPAHPAPPALLQPAPCPVAADTGLPIGSRCNVQTIRSGTQIAHSGKIVKVTSDWLVLESNEAPAPMSGVPILQKVPCIAPQFKQAQPVANQESNEIWIPRDAILFVSLNPSTNKTAACPALLCELQPGIAAKKGGVLRDSFIIRASATETGARQSTGKVASIDVMAIERSTVQKPFLLPVLTQPGMLFRIVMQSQSKSDSGLRTTYSGRIVGIQGDQLVIAPGRSRPRTESTYSLLSHFPWLTRYLMLNTVVGVESAGEEEIRIKLNQIASILPIAPSP